jgi:plasmid replication initiation protein
LANGELLGFYEQSAFSRELRDRLQSAKLNCIVFYEQSAFIRELRDRLQSAKLKTTTMVKFQ